MKGIYEKLMDAIDNGISKALDGDDMFDMDETAMNPIDVIEDTSTYMNHSKYYVEMRNMVENGYHCMNINVFMKRLSAGQKEMFRYVYGHRDGLASDFAALIAQYDLWHWIKILGHGLPLMERYAEAVRENTRYNHKKDKWDVLGDEFKAFENEYLQNIKTDKDAFYGYYVSNEKQFDKDERSHRDVEFIIEHHSPDFNLNWIDISNFSDNENDYHVFIRISKGRLDTDKTLRLWHCIYVSMCSMQPTLSDSKFYDEYLHCIDSKDNDFYAIYHVDDRDYLDTLCYCIVDDDCGYGFDVNLNWLDVSDIKYMQYAFGESDDADIDDGAYGFGGDISLWDVSNVVDMTGMFRNNDSFDVDISEWEIDAQCKTLGMFDGCGISDDNIPHLVP